MRGQSLRGEEIKGGNELRKIKHICHEQNEAVAIEFDLLLCFVPSLLSDPALLYAENFPKFNQ